MAGIIRWRDLQNILTTEDQINLLAGLTVNAALLNQLTGFTGTGSQLNLAVASTALLATHLSQDLAHAHPLLPNSLDGGILVDGTVAKTKLSFNALTDVDQLVIDNQINQLQLLHDQLAVQVQNLYTIAFPSLTGDIAASFAQLLEHIEKLENAHNATTISFGNDFPLITNALVGATQVTVSPDAIEFFKEGDQVEFKDSNSGPELRILTGVDYNGNQIGWAVPLLEEYRTINSAIVTNISGANVQQVLTRSLRNSTDTFTGRLTINQESNNDGLVINKIGGGYTARFNTFTGKSGSDFLIELGGSSDLTIFEILDSNMRRAFRVTDQGSVLGTDFTLNDRTTLNNGLITKQSLTTDRTWTLPDRTGYIGIGDLTVTDLLKVKLVTGTKQLTVAPGFSNNYDGEVVSAWISMDRPSAYPGVTMDIQARLITDNQILTLGNKWQVLTLYVTDTDQLNVFYGPQEATQLEAITEYINFIPSAYMKLAKLVVQGDGVGGIIQSSIQIIEDQRPFLTMGLSASYYEEVYSSPATIIAGTILTLPANSRAGGLIQTYRIGKAQLEVYLDGVYQDVGVDYEENQGDPIGRIRVLKDIAPNSKLKYRITFTAAAITGGVDAVTLQSAYQAGSILSLSSIYGPVVMGSFDMDTLMEINGSISVTNKIYNLKSLMFAMQASLSTDLDKNQIYVNTASELMFHQYKAGVEKEFNILNEIDDAKTLTRMSMFNAAGVVIPKGAGLALHPSLANSVVLCDTSNSLSTSRCIGVALENMGIAETKDIVTSGLFKLTGLGIAHNSIIVVDPRNPGKLVNKNTVTFLPTDEYQEVGIIDGGNLIVNLLNIPKVKKVWKVGIAGESFTAGETKLVRFAVDGETRGRVYKADKANANLDQKFWVVAAVQPSVTVVAGDSIDLYKELDLAAGETAFDDLDMGKPLYLTDAGSFKSWRTLNGLFTVGDAAIKIGMIEDRRKLIIDSIQMMGTAPGPTFN